MAKEKKKSEENEENEEVQKSAYYKWEEAGKPESDGKEFWFEAEKELKERE